MLKLGQKCRRLEKHTKELTALLCLVNGLHIISIVLEHLKTPKYPNSQILVTKLSNSPQFIGDLMLTLKSFPQLLSIFPFGC